MTDVAYWKEQYEELLSELDTTIHVAVAVYTKSITIRTGAAPAVTPISGRHAIFSSSQTTTTDTYRAEVLCVGTRQECEQAVERHRRDGVDYTITEHQIGLPPATRTTGDGGSPPSTVPCISCGNPVSGGPVKCQPCTEKHWASQGWRPTTKDEE
jgi:hypothetical protein